MKTRLRNPAVVLNAESAGIGIIHALSQAGVDIILVERNWPPLLGRFSRFPKLRVLYRPMLGESLAGTLHKLSERIEGKGVLFPSTDTDLETLIAEHDKLSERYHIPAARHLGLSILDKNWQYELAEQVGCPVPRHVRFSAGESLNLQGLRFPLIIKPLSRTPRTGGDIFRLRVLEDYLSAERCLERIARDYAGRGFQIAEGIPGPTDHLYTIASYSDRDGRVLRSYSGRKVSLYPYEHPYPYACGYTSVAETVTVPAELVHTTQSLLMAARFHGISQVEFKLDPRDGVYRLLEINARAWLWVKLAVYSGINLPLIQYYDLTGDPQLAEAVKTAQDDACFFIYDAHVKMNRSPAERTRIAALRRGKRPVAAIYHKGEWRLNLAYRIRSFFKGARARVPVLSRWVSQPNGVYR